MKVVFQFDPGPSLQENLDRLAGSGLEIQCVPDGDDEALLDVVKDCDAIWHVLSPISARIIAQAPRLKLIQKIGVGINTIDVAAAKAAGAAVCNMPGTNSRAVAEMTLLLMLSALRLQPRIDHLCRSGVWHPDVATRDSFSELGGKTVGFLGFGHVPQLLEPILKAMGSDTIFHTMRSRPDDLRYRSLDDVIGNADVLSLHLPLTDGTAKLLDRKRIFAMKPGAVLVNTARGGIIDETALFDALSSGHLRAAGLDVFANEPVSPSNPLLALDNVAVSPHLAWLTAETLHRSLEVAARNTLAIRDEKPLLHQIV